MLKKSMALSGLCWVMFPLVAHAQGEYRVDDGTAEERIGISVAGGGPSRSLMWANAIVGEANKPMIVAVRVAFGDIPNNTSVNVYVWSDGAGGLPGSVLRSASGLVVNTDQDSFNDYPITPVAIAPGQRLFVGAIINDFAGGAKPARIDFDGTDDGPLSFPPNNHSVIAGHTANVGAFIDPDDLPGAQLPVDFVSNTPIGDGNWLVRGLAPTTGACCDSPPGGCVVVEPALCLSPSTYLGDGTVCLGDLDGDLIDDACQSAPSGACCEPNGACTFVTPVDCALVAGATWNGASTQCQGDSDGNGIDDACEDCPSDFGWDLVASTGPSARFSHAMAYDAPNQRVVMFGGGSPADDQTWEWDGSAWTQRFPAVAPSARFEHTMAYHGGTNAIILFGGQDTSGTLGDTWMFQGNNWTEVLPANTPPARRDHTMSYDSARDVIVIFGGIDSNTVFLNDTWEWDGINWVERFPGTSPSPRFVHAMNYDSIRNITVLYGGGVVLNETWEWDGGNWTQRFPTNNPGLRNNHAQAFDAELGVTLLFGGSLGANSDLWAYDGNDWTIVGSNAPSRRSRPAMAYDAARRQIVLFSGTVNSVPDGETWVFPEPSVSRAFQVLGSSSGTGWSWCIDEPVPGFSVCDMNVPGVAAGGSAAALANRFVETMNSSRCPSIRAVANGSVFTVTIGGNSGFDFCVGLFGQQPGCCLPPSSSCPFNPDIEEVLLSGTDCNGNGIDDAIDIATDTSDDLDGNGIPDECERAIPTVSQWGLAAMVLLLLIVGTVVIKARKMPI